MKIVEPTFECIHLKGTSGEIIGGRRVISGWENSETTGAIVGGERFAVAYNNHPDLMFPWPVKILVDVGADRAAYGGRQFIAVRTDCFPLWWVVLWVQLRLAAKVRNDIERTVWIAGLFGWAETPQWNRPHWRDFLFVPRVNRD